MGNTYQSANIAAPVEQVWELLRNFHNMNWASPVIETAVAVGDNASDQVGAQRILNGGITETLLHLSDVDRTVKYRIDDAPGTPVAAASVNHYIGHIQVHPVTQGNTTYVQWSSSWEGNDGPATEFCQGVYNALLDTLSKHFA